MEKERGRERQTERYREAEFQRRRYRDLEGYEVEKG